MQWRERPKELFDVLLSVLIVSSDIGVKKQKGTTWRKGKVLIIPVQNRNGITEKFRLYRIEKNGTKKFRLQCSWKSGGKRLDRQFDEETEARRFVDDWHDVEMSYARKETLRSTTLTQPELRDAESALELLRRGETLTKAVTFYLDYSPNSDLSVKDAFEEWVASWDEKKLLPSTKKERKETTKWHYSWPARFF